MNTFPEITCVVNASEEEILKLWEGLGYYSRARNIKKAAEIIVQDFGGALPYEFRELKKLPGIGDYIAGALSSIVFGQDVPALEANGIRVFSRIINFQEEIDSAKSKKVLRGYLQEIVKIGQAGDINQAVMDLGSKVCLVNSPLCEVCPIQKECLSFANNTQAILPQRKAKKPIPHLDVVAAVIIQDEKVLITKRLANKLLGGMWEYPGGKVEEKESQEQALRRELKEELGVDTRIMEPISKYEHAYTHFSVSVYTFRAAILSGRISAIEVAGYKWVPVKKLDDFPMGKVDRLISRDLQAEFNF